MEIGGTGQIAYGDSCPMPLTGQQGTITSAPNGTFAPNLYVTGKDSGTLMIMGGSISGMVGAFRLEGSKHMTTRTALGADIEWTRSSSETPMRSAAASQVLPGQIQWPMGDVPAIAQRAVAYVRSKWQPDAFLTSIQLERTSDLSNAQSPEGGVMVQFLFYSPGQQQTLTFMPNSPASELMPGSSADPRDQRALPTSFMDLPAAVAKLRAKGLRGMRIKSAHLEKYGRGSYAGGGIGVFGTEWVIDSALDEEGVVLAELPDQNDARLSNSDQEEEGGQSDNLIHVEIAGLRNNRGQVYCQLFQSAQNFPSNTDGNAASTASTITNRRAACDFESQDPGSYAILVFHDEDSTHVLELNPNGTPREGVGLSNNPNAPFGLPSYDAAKFPYRTGTLNLTINMKYPLMQVSDATRSFSASADANASLTGFAFVDGSVTGQGSRAKLPAGIDDHRNRRVSYNALPHRWNDCCGNRLPRPTDRRQRRRNASSRERRTVQQRPVLSRPRPGSHTTISGSHLRKWFLRCSLQIRLQLRSGQNALSKVRVGTQLSDSLIPTRLRRWADGDGRKGRPRARMVVATREK